MKKLFALLICGMLLFGMLIPLAAEESGEDAGEVNALDQALVVHYDFNGDTLEEQLADKAPAGVSQDQLTLFSTEDENTGAQLSYISDGVAHIDHSINNYMQIIFDSESNLGTDVLNCAGNGEMTVFTAVRVSGSPQAWATFLDFNNVTRMLIKGSKDNQAIFSTLGIRGTTTMNDNANVEFQLKNADIYHDVDVVYIAVSYQYDAASQKLVGAVYLSFDYGKTYTETLGLFENVEEFISQCAHICFGKTRAGNQFKKTDHGSSYDFYDFRVYNKALTMDEVKTIQTGHEQDAPENPDPPVDTDRPVDTNNPVDTSKPSVEETTQKVPTTEPGTTTGTGKEPSGCASALPLGGVCVMLGVLLAGIGCMRKQD